MSIDLLKVKNLMKDLAKTEEQAFQAGTDCAKNGPNTDNCNFTYFSSPILTAAWESGKASIDSGKGH